MESINPHLRLRKRRTPSVSTYVDGILAGDRVVLSQAITLIESTLPTHQETAQAIIEQCLPHSGKSVRVGITGTPGVGKSTFIEAFGTHIIHEKPEHKVAVLAIDPSSQMSKGSILGDKTRMLHLSTHPKAFIRPSPAGDSLGGVARKTRESIILCEAAGFDTIIVETVGVGQSEIAVHSMTDFFLLLLLPGAGDELQGIKRGIVEMADLVAVNKADGDREQMAKQARAFYKNALHLLPAKESGWTAQVALCSALSKRGIPDIWQLISDYKNHTLANGFFDSHRTAQARYWLRETIQEALQQKFYAHPAVQNLLEGVENAVLSGKMSSFKGAEALLSAFKNETTAPPSV